MFEQRLGFPPANPKQKNKGISPHRQSRPGTYTSAVASALASSEAYTMQLQRGITEWNQYPSLPWTPRATACSCSDSETSRVASFNDVFCDDSQGNSETRARIPPRSNGSTLCQKEHLGGPDLFQM